MKFIVKQSNYNNMRWYIHLKGFGQYGETYATEAEAQRAAAHYNSLVSPKLPKPKYSWN